MRRQERKNNYNEVKYKTEVKKKCNIFFPCFSSSFSSIIFSSCYFPFSHSHFFFLSSSILHFIIWNLSLLIPSSSPFFFSFSCLVSIFLFLRFLLFLLTLFVPLKCSRSEKLSLGIYGVYLFINVQGDCVNISVRLL